MIVRVMPVDRVSLKGAVLTQQRHEAFAVGRVFGIVTGPAIASKVG